MTSIFNLVKSGQTLLKWKGCIYTQHGDSTILFLTSKNESLLTL